MTDKVHSLADPRPPAPETVRVWDGFVRVFHWSLVAGIVAAWLTADEVKAVHEWIGYGTLALVGARVIWGFIGTRHARFADFIRGPRATFAYLRDLMRGREKRYLGHNPAGAAMILALLCAVAGTGITGWLMTTDAFWGSEVMEDAHEVLATLILVLAAGHVGGVLWESLRHRENLVRAMFTGRKKI